jgi:hypothetical protein
MEFLMVGSEREVIAALSAGKGSVDVIHASFHLC